MEKNLRLSTGMTTLLDRFSKIFVGIEFKDDAIIITCLKNDLSGMNLLSSSTFPLREDDETIAEIDKFIAPYVTDTSSVFVSIPHKWSIIRFTEIPSLRGKGNDALIQMMRFEIERHIPYQIEEVFYDFQVLEKNEATYSVLFVAVHKRKIDYVKRFLEKISLQPQVITLTPFAILNSIEFSEILVGGWQELLGITKRPDVLGRKNEIFISLFIDKDDAHFAVLRGGSCVDIRSFIINQNNPLDVIVDDISSELSVLPPGVSHDKINKLILSGTITSLSDLSGVLGAKLGTNVQIINPVSKFIKDEKNTEIQKLAPSVGLCYLGLGMGTLRINLLPHKTGVTLRKTGSLTAKISVPLILFLIIGIFAGELVSDKRLLTKIEERLKENEPKIKVIEKLSADLSAVKQQRDFLLGVKESNILLDVLSELTNIMPEEAWITNFDYKEIHDKKGGTSKGELIISGYALSSSALIPILENSRFFEKVEFVGPITRRKNKEGFKIKAVTVRSANPVRKRGQGFLSNGAKTPAVPGSQIKKEEVGLKDTKES